MITVVPLEPRQLPELIAALASPSEPMASLGDYGRRAFSNLALGLFLVVVAAITWESFAFLAGINSSVLTPIENLIGPICHHLPERTFFLDRHALPVCARCTGIWIGWMLAGPIWLWTELLSRGGSNWIRPESCRI